MRFLVVLCLVLPALCRKVEKRIIGGSDADIGDYKYILSLRFGGSHSCGAVLITNTRAVTSAHCGGQAVSSYTVLGGTADRTVTTCTTCVLRTLMLFEIHENFVNDPNQGYPNDIGVLGFGSIATNANVAYAALATADDGDYDGSSCTTAGWGFTDASGDLSTILQGGSMSIISNDDCLSVWGAQRINDGQVCSQSPTLTACNGDTGGPLTCDGTLVGVNSWGDGGCDPQYPSVYIRVSYFYDWIMSQ